MFICHNKYSASPLQVKYTNPIYGNNPCLFFGTTRNTQKTVETLRTPDIDYTQFG